MAIALLASFLTLLTVQQVQAALYASLDALPVSDYDSFDFIVVGGGVGGAVVASRLTENPNFNVLLVEAGPDNEGVLNIAVPGYTDRIGSTYNWNYVTERQVGMNNRTFSYSRGHVLGGSSSINSMIYTRGSADDYNRWAAVTGDDGWSWDKLLPIFKRHERWVPPPGGRDVSGQFNPNVHGYEGPSHVSLPWSGPNTFDTLCIQNAELQKEKFPFNIDQNSGYPLGLTWMQSTIGNGERHSSATSYLTSAVRSRPNLSILINTYGARVRSTTDGSKDFRIIELGPRRGTVSQLKSLTAKKEVILSAGVIGSAHILLNSGIGDSAELSAVGITPTHHLPDVGKEVHDHVFAGITRWSSSIPAPPSVNPNTALEQWQLNRTGPLTEQVNHMILWHRIANQTLLDTYEDPAPGPTAPHVETFMQSFGSLVGGGAVLLTPYSRGTIKLRTTNPYDNPAINLNLLTHPFDILALKEGVKNTWDWYSGPVWEPYGLRPMGVNPFTTPDAQYENSLRGSASTFGHAVGSASMSARGSSKGVLDPDLKVKGVKGLRVIDAAAIPFTPTAHSQAAVYALAERGSDFIKASW